MNIATTVDEKDIFIFISSFGVSFQNVSREVVELTNVQIACDVVVFI